MKATIEEFRSVASWLRKQSQEYATTARGEVDDTPLALRSAAESIEAVVGRLVVEASDPNLPESVA